MKQDVNVFGDVFNTNSKHPTHSLCEVSKKEKNTELSKTTQNLKESTL